ncbi:Uncharacterised protein [Raoultella terrigena]|uniref:Uncharacterized protein n=1 Tax=Raoultella terrigena TaxID=577 RepID=A0A4U9D3S0_RAOTE|nr:Uncharacterised protein [Raoultella terrigena]
MKPSRAITLPKTLSRRSGVVVRQVTRSYIQVNQAHKAVFGVAELRSACITGISTARRAKVFARIGINVLRSWQLSIASMI